MKLLIDLPVTQKHCALLRLTRCIKLPRDNQKCLLLLRRERIHESMKFGLCWCLYGDITHLLGKQVGKVNTQICAKLI